MARKIKRYEADKRKLHGKGLSCKEYENAVKRIAKKRKV